MESTVYLLRNNQSFYYHDFNNNWSKGDCEAAWEWADLANCMVSILHFTDWHSLDSGVAQTVFHKLVLR